MSLSTALHTVFSSLTQSNELSQEERTRFQYYSLFLMFGIPLMIIFGISNYLKGSHWVSILAAVSALGLSCGWYLIKFKKQSILIYRVNAVLYLLLLCYLVVHGGEGGSKVLWIYTFPLVCYFLFGKREGTIWSGCTLTILTVLLFLATPLIEIYSYHIEFKIRLLASYFTVTGIAYWLEHLRNHYHTSLQSKNKALAEEIEERKRIEKQLEQLILEVQAANQAKSAFLANMSHEIRTPLNGVIGMTSMLSDTRLDAHQQHYVNTLRTSGEFLLTIINDILDVTKIEAGKFELHIHPFYLREMLDRFIDIVTRKIYSSKVELVVWADPSIPPQLTGDSDRLQQILLNLTTNALKFTPEGNVTVKVTLQEARDNDIILHFSVTDTGIGITKENQAKLFQSFSQIDTSTTREFGGTGLGLHICKQLCELMGGEIGVESIPSRGSNFWFSARFRHGETSEKRENDSSLLHGKSAIIAAKSPALREMLTEHLSYWGARVEAEIDSSLHEIKISEDIKREPADILLFDKSVIPGSFNREVDQLLAYFSAEKSQLIFLSEDNSSAQWIIQNRPEIILLYKPVHYSLLREACTVSKVQDNLPPYDLTPVFHTDPPENSQWENSRLLLAEDNPVNREVLLGLLEKAGFSDVDTVDNGVEVLTALEETSYDLILMDVSMPKMDGLTVTTEIRRSTFTNNSSQLPIIALTAHAITGDRERCIEAGMNDYLTKPINPEELLEKLELWMLSPQAVSVVADASPQNEQYADDYEAIPQFEYSSLVERMLGDKELVRTVLELFLTEAPEQLEQLSSNINEGNFEESAQLAHKIAGGVANLSITRMHAIAKEIQHHCNNQNRDPLAGLLSRLNREYLEVEEQITSSW